MSGYPSYAAWEEERNAIEKAAGLGAKLATLAEKDGEYLDNIRSLLAVHRPEASFGRLEGPDYSRIRGWRITTRVRIGFTDEFMEFRRILKTGWERAGNTR